jgi:hypothetical protein
VYTFNGNKAAREAIEFEGNRSRFIPPQLPKPKIKFGRGERESTQEPVSPAVPAHLNEPCLELRFSHGPQTQHGFVFGCDLNSDIVLPNSTGISFHHFALTFDQHYRPIVKDLGSRYGTQVTYAEKKEGKGWRSDFVWIVGGHPVPEKRTPIVIHLNNEFVQFRIVVHRHDITSQSYIDKVNRFKQGTATEGNLLGRLSSAAVRKPSAPAEHTHLIRLVVAHLSQNW